jgi:hypothetical protein
MAEKSEIVRDARGIHKDLVLHEEPIIQESPSIETQAQPEPEQEPAQVEAATETEVQPEPAKETRAQQSFKALKAEAARIAKERDEYQALLRQYEQEKKARQVPMPVQQVQDEDYSVSDDAIVEGKHLKQYTKELRSIKQELENARQETRTMALRSQLIAEHPDYERVVNAENLKALELTYPHLAKAINVNDPYNAGKACYDLIKQNMAKPKVAAQVMGTKTATQSPMGRASEFYEGPLTDEMKKIFYKELKDAMNTGR